MIYIITWGLVLTASASAVAALVWAVNSGQFQRVEQGATSIFDGPEAEREEADHFPGEFDA